MRLTVLGKSPAWPDEDGACSGYLLEDGDSSVLIDCGTGVYSKLRRLRDPRTVDALVISHLHADHFLDLFPYAYGLMLAAESGAMPSGLAKSARPRLIVPPGARRAFRSVAGAWGSYDLIEELFAVEEYDECTHARIGSLGVTFAPVPHYIDTYAMSLTSTNDFRRLVFGADCAPNDALVDLARGCDLLLVEATLEEPEPSGDRGHLSALEAGEHGRLARAKRLVITHFSDQLDVTRARAQAADGFGRAVEAAREGLVLQV